MNKLIKYIIKPFFTFHKLTRFYHPVFCMNNKNRFNVQDALELISMEMTVSLRDVEVAQIHWSSLCNSPPHHRGAPMLGVGTTSLCHVHHLVGAPSSARMVFHITAM